MLDFDGHRSLDPEHQRGGFRRLAIDLARPEQLDRFGVGGDVGADDVLPSRHQFGRSEALLLECVREELRCEFGELADGAGLVHGALLCHIEY